MHNGLWIGMNRFFMALVILMQFCSSDVLAYDAPSPHDLYLRIAQHPSPRLMLTDALVAEFKASVTNDARLQTYINRTISMADQIVITHDIGLRDAKGNETIFLSAGLLTLGMAWKMTGNVKYATEAVHQIKAKTLDSSSWTNTNGLQMGAFLSGIAIGWDLFRNEIPSNDRSNLINKLKIIIGNYQKFYRGEMGSNNWVPAANHNWNPVFNSGYILLCLSMGNESSSIAPSSDPTTSGLHDPKDYLDKAIENLPHYFNIMSPSGVDSEGVGYWMYGMIYGTMTLDGLLNATGSDLGLVNNSQGLTSSCYWAIAMTSPQGRHGIISDPQDGWWGRSHFPMLWFAKHYGLFNVSDHNDAIWDKYYQGGTILDPYPVFHALWHRTPASMATDSSIPIPLDRYFPSSDCPMAITRGSTSDSQAQWAYLKAGRITNHGHANQGGFMYEAMGITWVSDLGKDDYGISGYFSEPQALNSIYRKQTRAKSCFLIGDLINQKLIFSNDAPTTMRSFGVGDDGMQAVADLTPAYPRAAKAWRGMASMKGRKALLIQDEITLKSTDDIIWNMMTQDVSSFQLNGNTATLNKGGKQLKARILRPINAVFSLENATPPTTPTGQNLNATCKRLSIKLLQATGDQTIAVLLSPQWSDGERIISATDLLPLNSWETHIKSPQSISFTGIPTKTYGDAAFLLSATTTSGLPISYVSSNTTVATVAGSLVTIKSAGTAIITATQNGDVHYLKSAPLSQTLTVNKATLTAVAYDKAKTVGMPNPHLDGFISGLKNSDSPSSIGLSITYTCAAMTSSAVGGYSIVPSSSATLSNYTIVYKSGLLTISPKRIPVITWPTPSNITYGTALGALQLNATASISGTLSYTPTTGTILSAGNHKILSVTFTPTDGDTYTTATGSTLITVTKKSLTVTGNSPSRSYGSTNPNFTLSYQGFVGTDNTSTLNILPVPTCSATITSPPGTYDITVSGGSDDNYSMAPVKGTLTVTKAGQTISFGTLPSKDYGTGSITLTGTSNSGLPVTYTSSNSSVATITGSQVFLQSAGTTVITATQTGDVNFLPAAPVSQALVVNKANLTVTAYDKFRFLGTSNPPFDGIITGFKGSDTAAKIGLVVSFSCSATSASIPGIYPITATGVSATTNYHLTYKSGQLTVSPKVIPVITWPNPDPMVFGTPLGQWHSLTPCEVPKRCQTFAGARASRPAFLR